jgi:hypothetical protein
MSLQTRPRGRPSPDEAKELAVAALSFLAADPERLGPFMAETGLGPENMRAAAAAPSFFPAVLDYLIGNEAMLLDFAADQGIDPAMIPAARTALPGARSGN